MSHPLLPVIQQDRDAAASLTARLGASAVVVADIRAGRLDYWPSVQAFAAYRLLIAQQFKGAV